MKPPESVLVVGASVGGLSVAEALRREGRSKPVVVGDRVTLEASGEGAAITAVTTTPATSP